MKFNSQNNLIFSDEIEKKYYIKKRDWVVKG
jgi:hypothetical protein